MNGVVGMIDLLRETKLDDEQRLMMGTVRGSAFSLLQIINDILDFSKIEAGRLGLESIPISICDTLEGVAATLAPNAYKKNVRVAAHVDPNIPEWVIVDQVRLRQILFNLGGNAVKFTHSEPYKQGYIEIRADRLDNGDDDTVIVRYSIIDNGIGIAAEAQDGLFDAFTQAESSTARIYGGTGLGLSICTRLTELMGGEIAIESELGKGSTFSVKIPHARSLRTETEEKGTQLDGVRVLLVSAVPHVRQTLIDYLKFCHAEVAVVEDIEDAYATAVDAASPDFSNPLMHRGGESRKMAIRQSLTAIPERPRCKQSVAQHCSNLNRLNGTRLWPGSMAESSHRMPEGCCWGGWIAASG